MNTFAELLPSPSRTAASLGHSGHDNAEPAQRVAADGSGMTGLSAAVNRRESVQSNLQTQRALDASPRVTAQAKLASALSKAPVQLRCGPQKKIEPLTGTSPQEGIEEDAVIQSKSATSTTGAVAQLESANRTGLPDSLKSGVEAMSGLAMDDVRVHYNSDKPAQLQAHAYTQGSDIHVAPGQEQHLAHEAWHVVQQKQGRVAPTAQLKGVALNDDDSLEKEADAMGARAFQMKAEKPETSPLSFEQSSSPGGSSVFQMARKRRKEFKNERQRLATEKRMGPVQDSMEQMEEESEEAAYEEEFDRYMVEGMQLILGEETGGTGDGVRFGAFSDAYDNRYWNREVDESEEEEASSSESDSGQSDDEISYKLVLKQGVKPAAAIDYLFANLNEWALDCAESIQVARWYAMRHAMGAKAFNASMKNMSFELKSHSSTGLYSEGMYSRLDEDGFYDPDETLKFKRDGAAEGREARGSAESIIRHAPIGTRLMLTTDDDEAAGTDYENENMVKIGPDRFAAHPLGVGSLAWMIREIAKTVLEIDEDDGLSAKQERQITKMSRKIYISEIEFIKKR